MCLHPSVSLNNEHNCREIREYKMSVCKKPRGFTVRELFEFELNVFESVGSSLYVTLTCSNFFHFAGFSFF